MSRARAAAVLFSLFLLMFGLASQFMVVPPILPDLGAALDIPEHLQGTLVTAYGAATGLMALVGGPISDRFGRRAVLRVGSTAMALSLFAHSLATDYSSILILRALAGCSSGIMAGAGAAYIGDVFPYEVRGKAMGIMLSGMAAGQILGVPMGTLLSDAYGFQWAFISIGIGMAVAALLCATVIPFAESGQDRRLSVTNAFLAYRDLLRQGPVLALTIGSALNLLGVSLFIIYLPTWLEAEHGAKATDVALFFLVGGLAQAVAGPIAGRLSDLFGRKVLVVGASLPLGFLMAGMAFVPSFSLAMALFMLIMVGAAARMSPLNTLMTAMVDGQQRGILMALSMFAGQAGFAIGGALAGWSHGLGGYAANAMLAAVGTMSLGVIVGIFVPEPRPEERPAPAAGTSGTAPGTSPGTRGQ